MPLNACELEIDLFCSGMRLPPDVLLAGARGVSRTRAGLGSGLEIAIPAPSLAKREIWVNVPVAERFARASPYRLAGGPGQGHSIISPFVSSSSIPSGSRAFARERPTCMGELCISTRCGTA